MKRTVMGSLVVLMVCTTVCTSFAEGELVGKWSTTGMYCYGTVGVSILTLTLTWQDTFYQANLVVFTVAGTVAYETSGNCLCHGGRVGLSLPRGGIRSNGRPVVRGRHANLAVVGHRQ